MNQERLHAQRFKWEKGRTPVLEIESDYELIVVAKDGNDSVHVICYFPAGDEVSVSCDYSGEKAIDITKAISNRLDINHVYQTRLVG